MFQRDNQDGEAAFPEARIVKYSYLEDYYDAKDSIKMYNKGRNPNHLRNLKTALIGLFSQLRVELATKKKRDKYKEFVEYMDKLTQTTTIPEFNEMLNCFYIMQQKLKEMKVLDITFPDADIKRDFRRSF